MFTFKRKRKQSPVKNVLGLLLMIGFVLVILLPPPPTLMISTVRHQINELNKSLVLIGPDKGLELHVLYDDIKAKGWGFARRLVIVNPRLLIIETEDDGKEIRTTIGTQHLELTSQKDAPHGLVASFTEPLTMKEENVDLLHITFNEAPQYRFTPLKEENKQIYRHSFKVPGEIKLITPQRGDTPEEVPSIDIFMDAYPKIELNYYPEENLQTSDYHITNLRIQEPEAQIGIAELTVQLSKHFVEENKLDANYSFTVKDLTTPEFMDSLGAVSGQLELGYTGEADARPLSDAPRSGINELLLKNFVMASQTLNAKASGIVKRSGDDPYPYGKIEFTLNNLKGAMDKGLLDREQYTLWTLALQRITSQTTETFDNATFTFSREKNGEFMLGAASLQEIVGLILGKYFPGMATPQE